MPNEDTGTSKGSAVCLGVVDAIELLVVKCDARSNKTLTTQQHRKTPLQTATQRETRETRDEQQTQQTQKQNKTNTEHKQNQKRKSQSKQNPM